MKFNKFMIKPSNFFHSLKKKTIFLDPNNSDGYEIQEREKLNIILSPSLYWVKKVTLPIKYVRDVKKLLPSLFEEILPTGNYSYTAYKVENEFFIFAYEDKLILDTFSKCGILPSSVAGIYFAQSELQGIDGAVNINETQSIYVRDDIVVLVPCCWIEETGDLDLADLKLSKHKVSLQQYAHIVDNSSLYKIGAILVVLVFLLLTEIIMTDKKTEELLEKNSEIFSSYKLKPTMFQNSSMLKKYTKIHKTQTEIREYISYILRFKLQGSESLLELKIEKSTLSAKFSNSSNATLSRMKKMFKAKKVKNKLTMKDKTLSLEIKL